MNYWEAKTYILKMTHEVLKSGGDQDDLAALILNKLEPEGYTRKEISELMDDVRDDLKSNFEEKLQ